MCSYNLTLRNRGLPCSEIPNHNGFAKSESNVSGIQVLVNIIGQRGMDCTTVTKFLLTSLQRSVVRNFNAKSSQYLIRKII